MTQVDLPQISLQRYVDLLKRRRWQLVPVSLLGLLIGGMVAFLIPRYYVTETLLQHDSVPGRDLDSGDDPFRRIVDSAQKTIPLAVEEAMRELKWPEALVTDPFELQQNVREVADRVKPYDTNNEKGRTYAQIRVHYSDQNGLRAAMFLNTLVDVWMRQRIEDLRAPRIRQQQEANEEAANWARQYEVYLGEKKQIEREYGIAPNLDPVLQREALRERNETLRLRQEALAAQLKERAALKVTLEQQNELLATMPARVVPDAAYMATLAAAHPEAAPALLRVQALRDGLTNCAEGSVRRANVERTLALEQAKLAELITLDLDEAGMIANPLREALRKLIADNEAKLAGLDAAIAVVQAQTTAENAQLDQLSRGFELYEAKLLQLETAKTNREKALKAAGEASDILGQLQKDVPVHVVQKANTPPVPTEPNILLVALVGCLFGLGIAIGLVLLFDLMQATFKTVDDVERGVPVPVLGGMSHLETEEERVAARRSRRRTSLIAVSLTSLVAIIVTIYYVDNTRLPAVVRDVLALLLGS